jgi:NAD(P)H-nitrite reductase large subunit
MNIIIVGNGIAANSAAESIRCLNPQAKITLISEEPFPEYSACALCSYISGELPRQRVFLKNKKDYTALGIKALLGKRVDGIDGLEKKVVIEDQNYFYDKLILATGSEPMVPPIKGVKKRGVFRLKTLGDAQAILRHKGKKAVVIGSGPIGIEATVALKEKGYDIHLVELLGWILPRLLEEECSGVTADILYRNGVHVMVGEKVNEIYGQRGIEGVSTDHRQIHCDTVILSAGVKPRTELAKKIGISLGQFGGIKVNSRMETDQPDIYACGDCAEVMLPGADETVSSLLWLSAKQQGEIAGWNAAGMVREYSIPMNVISLRVFDTYVASISHPKYSTDQKYEKIEKRFKDLYFRMVFEDGIMKSIQTVGKSDEMGIFYSFLRKGTKIERIKKYMGAEEVPPLFPVYERIRNYLS